MITTQQNGSPNSPTEHPNTPYKHNHSQVAVLRRYKECLKNHAASIGGNAVDGCGEFMPSGGNDPSAALQCSACGCHRNFHRKEAEGEAISRYPPEGMLLGRFEPGTMANMGADSTPSELNNDHGGGYGARPAEKKKRRFRTKFSEEQKEKLVSFAEKAGWKMHKLDQCEVQQFCQEIGISRKVLQVWVHNNKHSYANKEH